MKMTKKFDELNDTFNVTGEIVSADVDTSIEKVEKIASTVDDVISYTIGWYGTAAPTTVPNNP